jgi:hypothetical protein
MDSLQQNLPAPARLGDAEGTTNYYRTFPLCGGCARCLRALKYAVLIIGQGSVQTRYTIIDGVLQEPPVVLAVPRP